VPVTMDQMVYHTAAVARGVHVLSSGHPMACVKMSRSL